jgi:hypothetical protein
VSARLEAAVAGPFDAALEYARRAPLGGRALGALDAVRAEAGLRLDPVRLALGATVLGFTGDGLDPSENAGRIYLRATMGW